MYKYLTLYQPCTNLPPNNEIHITWLFATFPPSLLNAQIYFYRINFCFIEIPLSYATPIRPSTFSCGKLIPLPCKCQRQFSSKLWRKELKDWLREGRRNTNYGKIVSNLNYLQAVQNDVYKTFDCCLLY